jgi:nucleoside-diphosphate-sugar epimerase
MADAVLITGSSGFLGRALEEKVRGHGLPCLGIARTLSEDSEHRAIDMLRDPSGLEDFLSERRPYLIFHLAGGTESGDLFAANVGTTKNLFQAVARVAAYTPRLIILGSAAEYGDLGSEPIREIARERPVNEYGVAKLAQTRLALVARRRGQRATVVRLFNVIGPGMSAELAAARFAREALAAAGGGRRFLTVGDLNPVRDFLDIEDVTAGLWALAHAAKEEEIVNLCSGEAIQIRQLLDEILRQVGLRLEVRIDPQLVRGLADIPVSIGDCSRLMELTGLRLHFSIGDSIARLVRSLR